MSVPFVLIYTHTFSTVQYICTLYVYTYICVCEYVCITLIRTYVYLCVWISLQFTFTYLMQAMLLMMWSLAERLRDSTLSWRRWRSPTPAGSLTTWTATGWRWTAPPSPPLQLTELEDDWRFALFNVLLHPDDFGLCAASRLLSGTAPGGRGLGMSRLSYAATRCSGPKPFGSLASTSNEEALLETLVAKIHKHNKKY